MSPQASSPTSCASWSATTTPGRRTSPRLSPSLSVWTGDALRDAVRELVRGAGGGAPYQPRVDDLPTRELEPLRFVVRDLRVESVAVAEHELHPHLETEMGDALDEGLF